jgi:hypothetical protein
MYTCCHPSVKLQYRCMQGREWAIWSGRSLRSEREHTASRERQGTSNAGTHWKISSQGGADQRATRGANVRHSVCNKVMVQLATLIRQLQQHWTSRANTGRDSGCRVHLKVRSFSAGFAGVKLLVAPIPARRHVYFFTGLVVHGACR